jgi:hypothetical protein
MQNKKEENEVNIEKRRLGIEFASEVLSKYYRAEEVNNSASVHVGSQIPIFVSGRRIESKRSHYCILDIYGVVSLSARWRFSMDLQLFCPRFRIGQFSYD